jgi:hypothetical protein
VTTDPQTARRARIVAAIKSSPFEELRTVDHAPNGPLQITVRVDDLADTLLRALAAAEPDDTDLTEADVDRMMAAGTPVQIVTTPPDTHGAVPSADRPAEEAYRLAVSTALGLGTGATWEAIRDRAEDLTAEVAELTEAGRRILDRQRVTGESTDLPAILRWAADHLATVTNATPGEDVRQPGMQDAIDRLRWLAVEAQQQTEPECTCGGPISSTTLDSGITYEQHRRDCAVMADSPAGAGEEPADETREAEAHPPTHTWKVESPRRDQWASWGATHDERVWAAASYDDVIEAAPQRPFRLVRATTTYAVEAEHQPAAVSAVGAQQPTEADRG